MTKITLKMAREMSGYSVEEVAERVGVSATKIIRLEEKPEKLRASIAIKLRLLYGIPLDYIKL